MRKGVAGVIGSPAGIAVFAIAGCGGGSSGGGGTSPTAPNSQFAFGRQNDASFSYSGQPKTQITRTSGNVTVQAQCGATFYNVNVGPAPAIAGSYLVIDRGYTNPFGGELDRVTYPSGATQLIYKSSSFLSSVTASPTGVLALNDQALPHALRTIKLDGTGLGSISFTLPDAPYSTSFAPDSSGRIAFIAGEALWVAPATGGAPTGGFSGNTWGSSAAWSTSGPDSQKIIFAAYSGLDFKPVDLFEADSSGGGSGGYPQL